MSFPSHEATEIAINFVSSQSSSDLPNHVFPLADAFFIRESLHFSVDGFSFSSEVSSAQFSFLNEQLPLHDPDKLREQLRTKQGIFKLHRQMWHLQSEELSRRVCAVSCLASSFTAGLPRRDSCVDQNPD